VELKNCRRCKRLFVTMAQPICPSCLEEEEKDFETVKEYLEEYPQSTSSQIAEGTGVAEEVVVEFIKAGRLVPKKAVIAYSCELCRKPIHKGRLCKVCMSKLESQLRASLAKQKEAKRQEEIRDMASKFIQDLREKKD
jgi:flagellar operon protein (TIGR03826 family)